MMFASHNIAFCNKNEFLSFIHFSSNQSINQSIIFFPKKNLRNDSPKSSLKKACVMGRNAIFQTARASHSVAGGSRFSSSAIDKGWALPLRPRARASIVWRTSVAVGNAAMPRTLSSRIVTVKKKAHEKKINQFFRPLFFVILFPSQLTVEHASSDARSVARPLERGIDTAASLALLWCRVIGTHYCNLVIAKQIANSYLTINRLTAGRETNRPTKTNTTHNKSIRCRPKIAVLCVESRLRSFEKTSCWFFFLKKNKPVKTKQSNYFRFDLLKIYVKIPFRTFTFASSPITTIPTTLLELMNFFFSLFICFKSNFLLRRQRIWPRKLRRK